MGPNPTDNRGGKRESAGGLRRDDDRLVWTSTAGHDRVIGGRGDTEEVYKEGGVSKKGMTSGPDSDYIEPRHISLPRLSPHVRHESGDSPSYSSHSHLRQPPSADRKTLTTLLQ